ncbi:hypothetical protein, partial [Amycolatopsis speibonae]
LELRRQYRLDILHRTHNTSMTAEIKIYGLFIGAPRTSGIFPARLSGAGPGRGELATVLLGG